MCFSILILLPASINTLAEGMVIQAGPSCSLGSDFDFVSSDFMSIRLIKLLPKLRIVTSLDRKK